MAEESQLIIQVDLDAQGVEEGFNKLEKESKKSAKVVGTNYEKALGQTFNKNLNKNINETNNSLSGLTKRLASGVAAISSIVAVGALLEKRFGLISRGLEKFGLDSEKTFEKLSGLKDAFDDFLKGEANFTKLKIAAGTFLQEIGLIDSKAISLINTLAAVGESSEFFITAASGLAAVGLALRPILNNGKSVLQLLGGIGNILSKSGGLFGAIASLGGISAGFAGLAKSLEGVDNTLVKLIKTVSIFVSILSGSLAAALGLVVLKTAEFSQKIGTDLVRGFQAASDQFIRSDSNLTIFTKTVENFNKVTSGAVGSTESWLNEINSLSSELNIAEDSLVKAAQEIIQVGSQLGLQEDQLKDLVKVTAEYAKINKKDVFDTSVAIVGALNGQSQAVQALGIKLNEASVQQFAYKKGLTENIRSLASGEVVQLRYNKLIDQYSNISGIASVAAGSLADQQKKLELNQKRLGTALGKGAVLIEQNNIVAAAYNTVLNNVNENIIATVGFFGALGARILQIGGFILGITFKTFALVKAFKILQLVLANPATINAFAAQIPLVDKSLNELLSTLSRSPVVIKDFNTLIKALRLSLLQTLNTLSLFATGTALKSLTFFKAIRGVIARLIPVLVGASKALIVFLAPLAPLIIKAALISGAVFLLFKAFQKLEERTGALTTIWNVLTEVFTEGASVFAPIVKLIKNLTADMIELGSKAFGLVITGLAKLLQGFLALANTGIGKKFLSQDQIDRLTVASGKLNVLSNDLIKVGFDFRKLGDEADKAGRKIAGVADKIKPEDFANLTNQLKDVGKSQIQILTETRDARLKLLQGALKQGLTTDQTAFDLRNKILLDFNAQRNEILQAQRDKEAQARQQAFDAVISLENELAEFGLSELERIDLQQQDRLARVNQFLESEIISYQRAENIKSQIVAQANKQRFDVVNASLTALNKSISKQIQGTTVKIFSAAFQEIGRTLAGAGQGFKAFLGVVLNILGDLAISIGTTVIGSSKAIAALKKSLLTSPAAPIALGGALIAVGAALKVFAGSLGGSSAGFSPAGGGGGGGGAFGPGGSGFDQTTFTTPEVEREDPEARFQLIVQGDIFETEDTARRITNLFQQAAEDEGLTFENGAFA